MPKLRVRVKIDWLNGKLLPNGTWTGARAIMPKFADKTDLTYRIKGIRTGGMQGWADGELHRIEVAKGKGLPEANYADIYVETSADKVKEIDASKDIEIKALIDREAEAIKPDLTNFLVA